MKRFLLAAIFGLALQAQPYGGRPSYGYGDRYETRDSNFAARIERGQRAGLITHREAEPLRRMERELRRETERADRSGHGISPRERARIERMRAGLDREITHQIRDNEN